MEVTEPEKFDTRSKQLPNHCRLVASFYRDDCLLEDIGKEFSCEIELVEGDGYTLEVGIFSNEVDRLYDFQRLVFTLTETPKDLRDAFQTGVGDYFEG